MFHDADEDPTVYAAPFKYPLFTTVFTSAGRSAYANTFAVDAPKTTFPDLLIHTVRWLSPCAATIWLAAEFGMLFKTISIVQVLGMVRFFANVLTKKTVQFRKRL